LSRIAIITINTKQVLQTGKSVKRLTGGILLPYK